MTLLRFRSGQSRSTARGHGSHKSFKRFSFLLSAVSRLLRLFFKFFFVVHPLFSILYFLHRSPSFSREHLASVDAFLGCSPSELLHFLSSSLFILSNNAVSSFFSLSLDFGRCLVAALRLLLVWANFLWPYCRPVLLHLWELYLDLPRMQQLGLAGIFASLLLLLFLHLNGTLSRGAAVLRRTGRRISCTYTRVTALVAASAPFVLACLFYLGFLLLLGSRGREQLQTLQQLLWLPLAVGGTVSCFWRFVDLPRLHPILLFCRPQSPVSRHLATADPETRDRSPLAVSSSAGAAAPQRAEGSQLRAGERALQQAEKASLQRGNPKAPAVQTAVVARENSWAPFQRWTSWGWPGSSELPPVDQTACTPELPEETEERERVVASAEIARPTFSSLADAKVHAEETRNAWMRITFWLEVWVFMTTCNFVAWLPLVRRLPFVDTLAHHVLSLFFILTVISGGPTQATIHRASFRVIRSIAGFLSALSSRLFGVALVLPSQGDMRGGAGIFYFPEASAVRVPPPSASPRNSVRRSLRQVFSLFVPFVSASSLSLEHPETLGPSSSSSVEAAVSPLVSSTKSYAANALCRALGFSSESWLSGLLSLVLHLPQVLLVFLPEFALTPTLAYLRAGRPLFGAVVSLSAPGPAALPERLYWLLYFLASSAVSALHVLLCEHNLLRYMPFQSCSLLLAVVAMQAAVKFLAKGAQVRIPEKTSDAQDPQASPPTHSPRVSSLALQTAARHSGREGNADRLNATEDRGRRWTTALLALFASFRRSCPTGAEEDDSEASGAGERMKNEPNTPDARSRHQSPEARPSRCESVALSSEARANNCSGGDRERSLSRTARRAASPASAAHPAGRILASGEDREDEKSPEKERGGEPSSASERAASQATSEQTVSAAAPAKRWADEEISGDEDDGLGVQTEERSRESEAGRNSRRLAGVPRQPERWGVKAVWRPRSGEVNRCSGEKSCSRIGRTDAPSVEKKGAVKPQVEERRGFAKRGGKTVDGRERKGATKGCKQSEAVEETPSAPERRQGDRRQGPAKPKGRPSDNTQVGLREDALQEWNLVDDDLSDE
ncbi:putative transmembrane protein [Toxoplasma gondii MAS]|uniref:Putative transmembrane protein n=1 Tax=Toxoplasma gondii MAS TaxID=943118 RepID=A0A086QRV4_TOXGO|nr:putative transmembrane protein [Toxoplasma gondii MAS]